jgi:RNA polymerase sigma-70 factor (ECF subfamily)
MPSTIDEDKRDRDPRLDSTDSGLLEAAKQLDPEAWTELTDRYSWLVFRWCLDGGMNADEAADGLQTVMMHVAKSLPSFKKDGKKAAFRRWLCTITNRRIVDFCRSNSKQPHAEGGAAALQKLLAVPEANSSASDNPDVDKSRRCFWEVIDRLEDEYDESTWQAFWLTTIENRTSKEAGGMLNMTANAVRLAKGRVLQRLRKEFVAAGFDDARLRSIK